jgi:hypothetical protein
VSGITISQTMFHLEQTELTGTCYSLTYVTLRPLCPVSVEHSSLPNCVPLHETRLAAARYKEIPRVIVGLCLFKT